MPEKTSRNTRKRIDMNIQIQKYLIFFLVAIATCAFTSCGSLSQTVKDPYFQEGFRRGWNATAPDEYQY